MQRRPMRRASAERSSYDTVSTKRRACSVMVVAWVTDNAPGSIGLGGEARMRLQPRLCGCHMVVMGGVRPVGVSRRDSFDHLAMLVVRGPHGIAEHEAAGPVEAQLLDEAKILRGQDAVAGTLHDVFVQREVLA